ncbi:hypothetical protein V2J09_013050 [Rumex salicifolius]
MLDRSSLPHDPKFVDMYNIVHIDEKWFYITKKLKIYYMAPKEDDPLHSCKSKNFIEKDRDLMKKAKKHFRGNWNVFTMTKQPALRRSRDREARTMETKPILSIIQAIQAMWPIEDSRKTIFIQQVNARTHVNSDDEEFQAAASQNGFDERLLCRPTNSPDLNALDLVFFSAIQPLQNKECATTMDGLIQVVEKLLQEYPTSKINRVFLTLQSCMKEIMREDGCNRYNVPHDSKDRLERNRMFPKQIHCEYASVENVLAARN